MSRRLLLTGARGLLGEALVAEAAARGWDVVGVARTEGRLPGGGRLLAADLADPAAAEAVVLRVAPQAVVHAAARTDVDWCEDHPEEARRLHADGSEAVARAAAKAGARLLHVSTDAVFDGLGVAYDEDSPVGPRNVYAATKLEGERRALSACPDALVLRVNFFGVRAGAPGRSLAEWALAELRAGRALSGFEDVRFNPLWSAHLAEVALDLVPLDARGVLHVGSPERVTKLAFLRHLAEAFGFPAERVREARAADRAWRAPRPACTVLSPARVEALLGRPMRGVREGIEAMRASAGRSGLSVGETRSSR